jgi:CheY-like chemotaxis protein
MPRSPLTVLVVDDDEGLRALLVGILSPGEHLVSAAASAEEALQLLPYQTFDLALLDHNLPGMEGLVLGEYLQRNNPRMEVVLVTGDDDPRVERSSLRAGLSFVAKPFLPRDIFDAVDRAYARLAERASDAPPPALEPVRLDAAARARIAEVFEGLNLPERWVARLQREARDRLAALKRRGDPVDRDVALACLVALALAGEKAPFEAYDAVAEAHGDRPIFGGRASTD